MKRPEDTCPKCGMNTVFACSFPRDPGETPAPTIDGCSECHVVWERETRENTSIEMCSNCAFRPDSPEVRSGEIFGILRSTIDGDGVFYCHKRVPFLPGEGFQHETTVKGSRVVATNAPVCAGWISAKLKEKRFQRYLSEEEIEATA